MCLKKMLQLGSLGLIGSAVSKGKLPVAGGLGLAGALASKGGKDKAAAPARGVAPRGGGLQRRSMFDEVAS